MDRITTTLYETTATSTAGRPGSMTPNVDLETLRRLAKRQRLMNPQLT
jgi:hypothetical protein